MEERHKITITELLAEQKKARVLLAIAFNPVKKLYYYGNGSYALECQTLSKPIITTNIYTAVEAYNKH